MDMRKIVEERLCCLAKEEAAVESMQEEIRQLKAERNAIRSARTDATPTGGSGNRRMDWLDNNIQQRAYLEERIKYYEARVAHLRGCLAHLDPDEQVCLDIFFINRQYNPEVVCANTLHTDERNTYRIRARALTSLTRYMYGGTEI